MSETTETHFLGKIAQKGLVVRNGKVLITRDSRDVDTWEIPGGRLNVNEDPKEGVARELREELGVDFKIGKIISIEQFHHQGEGESALMIVYLVEPLDKEMEFTVDPIEIAEMAWVDGSDWKQYKFFPELGRVLEKYFEKI